jgi:hypothetical protein
MLPDKASVVLFGSWGRYELTDQSDSDWALLIDDPTVDLEVSGAQEALRHLGNVFDDGKPPGRQVFRLRLW